MFSQFSLKKHQQRQPKKRERFTKSATGGGVTHDSSVSRRHRLQKNHNETLRTLGRFDSCVGKTQVDPHQTP